MTAELLTEAEVEALEWEVNVAGGQLVLLVFVILACVGTTALVTYVADELYHERHDESDPRNSD